MTPFSPRFKTSRKAAEAIALALAIQLLVLVAAAAEWSQHDIAAWVHSEGGTVTRNDAGDIIGVDLSSTWVRDADLAKLGGLAHLQLLHLSQTKITDIGLEHLAFLEDVRELNLEYAEAVTEDGVAHLKTWRHLERLNLRGTQVASRVFEHLAGLTALRSLDLGFSRVEDAGFEHLASLTELRRLAIGGNRLIGTALPSLDLLPSLAELDISGIQRVDSGLWGLPLTEDTVARLAALTRLEVLDLGGATLADLGLDRPGRPDAERAELKYIDRLKTLINLHTLDLTRLPVSSASLGFLEKLPKLRTLALGQIPRLDDSAVPLLLRLDSIETLNLAETGIGDRGLERLRQMKQLKHLFAGGSEVTREGAERFRQARPDCALSWWEKVEAPENTEALHGP
jgi:hypothetical protein